MIEEKNCLQSCYVQRSKPLNLTKDDNHLFQHEYTKEIPSFFVAILNEVFINHNLFVFSKFGIHDSTKSILRVNEFNFLKKCLITSVNLIIKKKIMVEGDSYLVIDNWSAGFFHWMLDVLPKICYFIDPNKSTILIPRNLNNLDFVCDSLNLLGYRNLLLLESNRLYKIECLKIINPIGYTGNYHPIMIESTQRKFANYLSSQRDTIIYISRRAAKKRRISNETELVPLFTFYKVLNIVLEDFTFEQQIRIISGAKAIIGVHGAGLSHLLFMKPKTRVLEIRSVNDKHNNCYFSLASVVSVDYYYYLALPTGVNDDLIVDVAKFSELVSNFVDFE